MGHEASPLEILVSEVSEVQTASNATMSASQPAPCNCRLCGKPLARTFANLGMSPLANSFVSASNANRMEPFYPLHAYVCESCWLVQLAEFEEPQSIFGDYLYFSSFSSSWLQHAERYAQAMIERFGLGAQSLVVEIASNDGYLLQYFARENVGILGVDPAANVVQTAVDRGIPTECAFFGEATAQHLRERGVQADLMAANNVLAHVPNIHDFLEGFRVLLAPGGVVTFEFPHLLQLMRHSQFDTIYHEHFSYLSLLVVERALSDHGLAVFDVEELPTHGGSLRVFARHRANTALGQTSAVDKVRADEAGYGLNRLDPYLSFAERTVAIKCDVLDFLVAARRRGETVVGYGAPAKGNTLLNYCGVGPELLRFTVDRSPHKQGLLLPGTRIPICSPDDIRATKPDFVLILPWNLRDEIVAQMPELREWGGRFVVPIPEVRIL